MNVEGLTRENVASHLQKFRLQLKRENKLDDEGNLISPLKGSKLGGSDEDAAWLGHQPGQGRRRGQRQQPQLTSGKPAFYKPYCQADASVLHHLYSKLPPRHGGRLKDLVNL